MRITSVCNFCGSEDIVYLGNDKCYCNRCEKVRFSKDIVLESPYERTRNQVKTLTPHTNFFNSHYGLLC